MTQHLSRTALYDTHLSLGGRMVPFAGWEMPLQYTGILAEARAVRTALGLFDISHMGRLYISGQGAVALLDFSSLEPFRCLPKAAPNVRPPSRSSFQ